MSKQIPLISIVIPVYNRALVFARSLETALAQDYTNIEIIVVDDGSEPVIVLPSEFSNQKIQLFRQHNQGAAAARNFGFSKATGEYVLFWDADLMAKPNMVSKMLQTLDSNPTASYVYCDFYLGKKLMRARPFSGADLKKVNFISANTLVKREDFAGFDTTLKKFQDWDLWLTLLEKNKTGAYVPEVLFTAVPGGTMSAWLPSFAYKPPFSWIPGIRARVTQYREARQIIAAKHRLQ